MIPYEKYGSSSNAILVHDGFSHFERNFNRLSEEYRLNTAFVLHSESLVMGNEATLLIKPVLTLNGRECDLALLKNLKATLKTKNYIDSIPVTKTYDNLVLEGGKEIPIVFQVPPNLQTVSIEFHCEVRNVTRRETEYLYSEKEYDIETNTNNCKYYQSFLRRVPQLE